MKLVSLAHQCGGPGCGLRPARFRLLRSPLGDIDDIGVRHLNRVVSKNTNELPLKITLTIELITVDTAHGMPEFGGVSGYDERNVLYFKDMLDRFHETNGVVRPTAVEFIDDDNETDGKLPVTATP